jgi:hypothetical protein
MRDFINIITELFDTETKLQWSRSDDGHEINAFFDLDGYRYEILFTLVHWTGKWECLFSLNLRYDKGKELRASNPIGVLGTGNAAKILSIVCSAIEQFMQEYSPRAIEFIAYEYSRQKLYGAMVRRLVSRLPSDYQVRNPDDWKWLIERKPKN